LVDLAILGPEDQRLEDVPDLGLVLQDLSFPVCTHLITVNLRWEDDVVDVLIDLSEGETVKGLHDGQEILIDGKLHVVGGQFLAHDSLLCLD